MSQKRADAAAKVTFSRGEGFNTNLKRRVDEYFRQNNLQKNGDWRLFSKVPIIFLATIASYFYLVFVADSLLGAVCSGFILAQSLALVGMDIMHDGVHESASSSRWVNRVLGFTIDLVGGSSYMWRQKHNILHHTYTNINGIDDDLETSGLLRLSPHQSWKPWHRFQAWYALPVYSLLTLSWVLYNDFSKYFSARIGATEVHRPNVSGSLFFFGTKILFVAVAIVVPLMYHPWTHVLVGFLGVQLVLGLTLSVVFQLAHTVKGNEFPEPDQETGKIETEWAVHQVNTTADFSPGSRFLTWYLGGLNFQVEHHLFPRISHIHYPQIAGIVRDACREAGLEYRCFPTLWAALSAHFRHLSEMGARA